MKRPFLPIPDRLSVVVSRKTVGLDKSFIDRVYIFFGPDGLLKIVEFVKNTGNEQYL